MRRISSTSRWVALVVAIFSLFAIVPRIARAEAPRATLRAASGGRGPVELQREGGAWTGSFFIDAAGDAPLVISRVAMREDDAVRVPRTASVELEGAKTVAPGTSRKVKVTWNPDPGALPELWGHVVVTTNDEQAGEIAIGVHAQTVSALGPLEGHLLTALFLVPLLGALGALAFKLAFPQGRPRTARRVAVGVATVQLALAALVAWRFRPDVTRLDGNDGLQLVERIVWIRPLSVEWYVGLDGHATLMVLLVAAVGALGAAASTRIERDVEAYFGLWLAAIAGATGVAIARDLVLFVVMLGLATLPVVALIGGWGRRPERARAAAGASAVAFAVSLVLLSVCAALLHHGATRTFLVDGTAVARGFAMPELERVAYTRGAGMIGGVPLVELAFVAGLVGLGLLAGLVPMHAWLPTAAAEAPAPVVALLVAIVPRLGIVGMVRVLGGVMPEGSRWASAATVGLGAISALHASAMLLSERDLSRVAAFVAMAQSGIALAALGSITPQGLVATGAIVLGGGLAVAVLALWSGALDDRVEGRDTSALGGLFSEAPLLAMLAAVAFAAAMGAPGTAPFWGELLAVIAVVGAHPLLSGLVVLALLLKGAAVLRVAGRVIFGAPPDGWRTLPSLEPFGGKFPDLRTHEGWAMAPIAIATVVLGVWPAPMLGVLAGAVRDAVARANLGPLQLGF